jgi:hypothetical protein
VSLTVRVYVATSNYYLLYVSACHEARYFGQHNAYFREHLTQLSQILIVLICDTHQLSCIIICVNVITNSEDTFSTYITIQAICAKYRYLIIIPSFLKRAVEVIYCPISVACNTNVNYCVKVALAFVCSCSCALLQLLAVQNEWLVIKHSI